MMASRSDSGNETRGSSESDNSPTPTKELQARSRFSPPAPKVAPTGDQTQQQQTTPAPRSQIVTPTSTPARPQINTRTTPISRTTPLARPQPLRGGPINHRLTPTAAHSQRVPLRPLRRAPGSGMGSASSVHAGTTQLGILASTRGRQRNSVAVVDSREHIYEELEMCRGPPKLTPVSGVLQQGKVVIRPIAFKPVTPHQSTSPASSGTPSGRSPSNYHGASPGLSVTSSPNGVHVGNYPPITGRPDPRYTSTPTLVRAPIQHYGSMGDLKSLGDISGLSLDRRGIGPTVNSRTFHDPYLENGSKFGSLVKLHSSKNEYLSPPNSGFMVVDSGNHPPQRSPEGIKAPLRTKPSPSSRCNRSINTSSSDDSSPLHSLPPPRPPSHQSSCSNLEACQAALHQRLSQERQLSSYDPVIQYNNSSYSSGHSNRSTSGYEGSSSLKYHNSDLSRFESLRNLSSDSLRYTSTGQHSPYVHHTGPASLHRMGGSVSNLSRLSHHTGSIQALDRSASMTGSNLGLDRSVSGSNFALERDPCNSVSGSLMELRLVDPHQTPSPSDSGVAELEAMLKEKDTEINTLRETMEQNEQVIFKVYEEKEKTWERELKKIRDLYDSRLKSAQQKALKVEQSLTTQTYQLQQERRKLTAELEEAKRERDSGSKQVEQLRKELTSLRGTLEETEWGLCQKSGEISLLKTQLKDSQGDQTTRGHELLHLKAQVRQYQQEVERRRAEISSLHDLTTQLRRDSADLRTQLDQTHQAHSQDLDQCQKKEKARSEVESLRREMESLNNQFEDERMRWKEEKERVIRYQKQLHHNYVSMFTRNRQLEEEVARLTGVPLSPLSPSGPPAVPPTLPLTYSEIRDGSSISIKSESRC